MRVSRRIRPSQVGCAASASRRRLQAASLTESPDTNQARPLPRPSLVIHPDGKIVLTESPDGIGRARTAYDDADTGVVASTRG